MEKLHGTLLRQQGITLDGHPGLEVVYSATVNNSDVTIKEHSYLVGPRLYVVQFMNIRAKLNEADADTFLNSFKLLPSKP